MSTNCLLLGSSRVMFARTFGKLVQSERPDSLLLVAPSMDKVLECLAANPVDLLLLDGTLALEESLAHSFERLHGSSSGARIVLVLDAADDIITEQAMALGAAGVLLKASPPGVIASSLALVLAGEQCRPAPLLTADVELPDVLCERLNDREQRLLRAMMRGESITSVSKLMNNSPQKTVQDVRRILTIVRGKVPGSSPQRVTLPPDVTWH